MEPVILIQFASRNRPERFKFSLDSAFKMAMDPDNIIVQAVLDADDEYLDDYKALIATHGKSNQILTSIGTSKSKIHAINRRLPNVNWDILVNLSDDMKFIVRGWDTLIRDGVRCNCPDSPGFLHYPEKDSGMSIAPMSVMTRSYYEIDGYIYHPSYISLWCDNEAKSVAELRKMYYYMGEILYQHLNPAYGHLPRDQMFDEQQAYWGVDEDNFNERKVRNFDLIIEKDEYDP